MEHVRATLELKKKTEKSVHEIMRLLLDTKELNPSIPWPDTIEGGVNFPAVWHDPIEKRIRWWYGLVITSPSRVVDDLGSTNVFIQAWGFNFILRFFAKMKLQKWDKLGKPLPWLNKD